MALYGVDVSNNQAAVDCGALAGAGFSFLYHKASEGTGFTDGYLPARWADARAHGLLRGAYHYAHPDNDAGAEAEHFLNVLRAAGDAGELAPVLDFEEARGRSPSQLVAWAHVWLARVQAATGLVPTLYTYPAFWHDSCGNDQSFGAYPLWWASYTVRTGYPDGTRLPKVYGAWSNPTLWQFAVRAGVPGVTGVACDLNVFPGDRSQLVAALGGGHTPTTMPPRRLYTEDPEIMLLQPGQQAFLPIRQNQGGFLYFGADLWPAGKPTARVRLAVKHGVGWVYPLKDKGLVTDPQGYSELPVGQVAVPVGGPVDQVASIDVRDAPCVVDMAYNPVG